MVEMDSDELVANFAIIIHEANDGSCRLHCISPLKRIKCDIFIASGLTTTSLDRKRGFICRNKLNTQRSAICCCSLSRWREFIYASIRNRKLALLEQHTI